MHPSLKTFLKELHLNDKEAEIYLTLLEIGSQAASVVAKKVQIPRSSVFFHLDNLIKKGFVQKEIKVNIQYFLAVDPRKLQGLLERRKNKISDQLGQLNELLPSFKALTSPFLSESKVTYFEGVEGLCKMVDEIITSQEDLYFISAHTFPQELQKYIRNVYVPSRKKAKNNAEMIIMDSDISRDYVNYAKDIYQWIGFIKKETIELESTIVIYGKTIQLFSGKTEDLTGVVIENKFLAATMKAMFQMIKESKKIIKVT